MNRMPVSVAVRRDLKPRPALRSYKFVVFDANSGANFGELLFFGTKRTTFLASGVFGWWHCVD
jgi:hypothetical protein